MWISSSRVNTTIYLPSDTDAQLTGHEMGHDELFKDEYDKHAEEKLKEAAKGLVGMKFMTLDDATAASTRPSTTRVTARYRGRWARAAKSTTS